MSLYARFEWDIAKAETNAQKHRVFFEDATALFADPRCLIIDTIRAEDGERRSKATGMIDGRLFTVVFVMRGDVCRLISARRSNTREERDYASDDDRLEQSSQDEP